jgi:hypothetical protein
MHFTHLSGEILSRSASLLTDAGRDGEKPVNLAQLSVGTKILLASGDRAEVVTLNAEAETVCVRYLDALSEPELVGTEAWLSADEVLAIDMGTHAEGRT